MTNKEHWERVYRTKAPAAVSWYRPPLELSLASIESTSPEISASIIDVGAGESTLVDDLLEKRYRNLWALDLSEAALVMTRQRLGPAAAQVTWLVTDILQAPLPKQALDIWHDRALFHFLTEPAQRAIYVEQLVQALRPGGYVILATLGPEGPEQCSVPDTARYDADSLDGRTGRAFYADQKRHRNPPHAYRRRATVRLLSLPDRIAAPAHRRRRTATTKSCVQRCC